MKVRTDAKRAAILEIASEAFLELGYERTSMAEISARVGGSKATLYGYFASKEALFIATTRSLSERYLGEVMQELADSAADDFEPALRRFAERSLEFLCSAEALATHRMIMAEAAHSEVGQLFYEAGPQQGLRAMASFLEAAMARGRLRRTDPATAAMHLFALVKAEVDPLFFLPRTPAPGRRQFKAIADRALTAFLSGYRPG